LFKNLQQDCIAGAFVLQTVRLVDAMPVPLLSAEKDLFPLEEGQTRRAKTMIQQVLATGIVGNNTLWSHQGYYDGERHSRTFRLDPEKGEEYRKRWWQRKAPNRLLLSRNHRYYDVAQVALKIVRPIPHIYILIEKTTPQNLNASLRFAGSSQSSDLHLQRASILTSSPRSTSNFDAGYFKEEHKSGSYFAKLTRVMDKGVRIPETSPLAFRTIRFQNFLQPNLEELELNNKTRTSYARVIIY
jgi:hypothetical protein